MMERDANSYAKMIYFVVGIALGYFGSCILFFEWIIAPFVGFLLSAIIRETYFKYRSLKINVLAVDVSCAIGIFFGGLAIWSMFAEVIVESGGSPILYLLVFIPATLFILGAGCRELFFSFKKGNQSS